MVVNNPSWFTNFPLCGDTVGKTYAEVKALLLAVGIPLAPEWGDSVQPTPPGIMWQLPLKSRLQLFFQHQHEIRWMRSPYYGGGACQTVSYQVVALCRYWLPNIACFQINSNGLRNTGTHSWNIFFYIDDDTQKILYGFCDLMQGMGLKEFKNVSDFGVGTIQGVFLL